MAPAASAAWGARNCSSDRYQASKPACGVAYTSSQSRTALRNVASSMGSGTSASSQPNATQAHQAIDIATTMP